MNTPAIKQHSHTSRLLITALLLVVIFGSYLGWRAIKSRNEVKVVYSTESASKGDIENLVTATGILQPRDYVDVGAQVSGQLQKLHVDVGAEVKAGDLLAEIDATVYAAKVDGTRAQLNSQKAQLLDREAQLALATISLKRQQKLLSEQATSTEAVETADANVKSAHAQYKVLEAQIQQSESDLRIGEANLKYAKIYSPISGTVVSITSRQGQTLNANQIAPTIMRIADVSTMTVHTQVSEADIGKLRLGMPVYFTTLGSQGRRWHSKLDSILPTPEIINNVVLYNALFDVPNEQRTLMTQMSTQVFFIESKAKDVVVVPLSAVNFNSEKSEKSGHEKKAGYTDEQKAEWKKRREAAQEDNAQKTNRNRPATVKVMKDDGIIEERKVLVGITNRVQAQIIEGINVGENVVSGSTRPNATAKVAPAGGWGGGAAGMGRR